MRLTNKQFFEQVEAMLAEGDEVQIRVRGNSMRPLLRDNRDTVVLAPCRDVTALQPGDTVLFRCEGRHILHRIVRIEGADAHTGSDTNLPANRPALRFTLAGDGNYRMQEHCTGADIAARAVRVIRTSGRVVGCGSRRWRWQSRCWLALPQIARKVILGVLRRMGYK